MRKIVKILAASLLLVLVLMACNQPKADKESKASKMEKNEANKEGNEVDTTDHGYEIAMASYQCPMKCEGDKTYEEEGACPKCKMDLKKIDAKQEDTTESHDHKE